MEPVKTICPVAHKTNISLLHADTWGLPDVGIEAAPVLNPRLLHEGVFFPAQQASWYRDLEAAGLEDFRFHDLRNT